MDTRKFHLAVSELPDDYYENNYELSWQGLVWERKDALKYSTRIKNLYLVLNRGYLTISNSLH